MLYRVAFLSALALAYGCVSRPASAQTVQVLPTCGSASVPVGPGGRLYTDTSGTLCTVGGSGGGGGGATGSVTAAGTNGTAAQAVQGINGGVPVPIQGGNATAVKTDGSATTQPISAAALPLPNGAATSANQATTNTSLNSIDTKTPSLVNGRQPVDGSGVTQPVSQIATTSIGVQRTTGIGTTGVQVSASDATNRRTVTNTSGLACELMGSAAAYGTGYPLPAGGSFTFDASGRTTAALFVACSASGGTVAVLSY